MIQFKFTDELNRIVLIFNEFLKAERYKGYTDQLSKRFPVEVKKVRIQYFYNTGFTDNYKYFLLTFLINYF